MNVLVDGKGNDGKRQATYQLNARGNDREQVEARYAPEQVHEHVAHRHASKDGQLTHIAHRKGHIRWKIPEQPEKGNEHPGQKEGKPHEAQQFDGGYRIRSLDALHFFIPRALDLRGAHCNAPAKRWVNPHRAVAKRSPSNQDYSPIGWAQAKGPSNLDGPSKRKVKRRR